MAIDMPNTPAIGDQHTDPSNNITYVWDGVKWTSIGSLGGGGGVEIGPFPPANPLPGDLWFNVTEGRMYVWYDDGDSTQWVDVTGT